MGNLESNNDEADTVPDDGYKVHIDMNTAIKPTQRYCYYCCKEGKLHPIEHFTQYPCCGYMICLECIKMPQNSKWCGECLTSIPFGQDVHATSWLANRKSYNRDHFDYYMARIFIRGTWTFVDELMTESIYGRKEPPSIHLALSNPPDVATGVALMSQLAEKGSLCAMLNVAEAYCSSFHNDPFEKDTKLAEHWFLRALGDRRAISPLAFTRYGQFLKNETRFKDALPMFEVAAKYGHVRGQYEYAEMVLGEEIIYDNGMNCTTKEKKMKAIEWLCEACETGFCIPAFVLLAQTLLAIAEELHGRADITGHSPLPRVIQILRTIESTCNMNYCESYKEQIFFTNETEKILKRFQIDYCFNCGSSGTEKYALRLCDRCGVAKYCSKVCQKRHFRDGHKYDCCDQRNLFDFHDIKTMLPWTRHGTSAGPKLPMLRANDITERSLLQMVEDDTDEIYGEDNVDYDEDMLARLMLQMRKNVEIFLTQNLSMSTDGLNKEGNEGEMLNSATIKSNLQRKIYAFSQMKHVSEDFVEALHRIREYGNIAAHSREKLDQKLCEKAVRSYRQHKEKYEILRTRDIDGGKGSASMHGDNMNSLVMKEVSGIKSDKQPVSMIQLKENQPTSMPTELTDEQHESLITSDDKPSQTGGDKKRKKKKKKSKKNSASKAQSNQIKQPFPK